MKRLFYFILTVLAVSSCGVNCKQGENDKIVIGLSHSGIPQATEDCFRKAVTDAGAEIVVFPMYALDDVEAEELVSGVDAVIIPGKGKLDTTGRGKCDHRIIKAAINAGKPVLGICQGHQNINSFFGGKTQKIAAIYPETAIQHKILDENGKNLGADMEAHPIIIDRCSRLYKILGNRDTVMVNTSHYYCTGIVSDSVKVVAKAPDGVVEAFEYGKNVLGVQFHPEYLYSRVGIKEFLPIFQNLINEASIAKRKKK